MKGEAGRAIGVRDPHDSEGCKLLPSGVRQMAPAQPADLQLQKKFSVLVGDKGLGAVPRAEPELAEPDPQQHKGQSMQSSRGNSI